MNKKGGKRRTGSPNQYLPLESLLEWSVRISGDIIGVMHYAGKERIRK